MNHHNPARILVSLLLLCLSGLVPSVAGAQGVGQEDCPDVTASVKSIRLALDEVRLEEAAAIGEEAVESLKCQSEVVNAITLNTLFQLVGAVHHFIGDAGKEKVYFGRAVAVSPAAGLDPSLGEHAGLVYEDIREQILARPTGAFLLGPDAKAWVNGQKLASGLALDVASGAHLVQIRTPSGEMINQIVRVAPEERFTVKKDGRVVRTAVGVSDTGGTFEAGSPPGGASTGVSSASTTDSTTRGGTGASDEPWSPSWGLVAGGGAAVVTGGVFMALAAATHGQFEESTDPYELEDLQRNTNTYGGVGLGMCVVGAGLAGAGFVVPLQGGVSAGITWTW